VAVADLRGGEGGDVGAGDVEAEPVVAEEAFPRSPARGPILWRGS
jgi:hypothetical protein